MTVLYLIIGPLLEGDWESWILSMLSWIYCNEDALTNY